MATATDQLDRTFAALSDSTRRAILARLAGGEATVTELAAPFRMSMPEVPKHLKVLEREGRIARGRDGQGFGFHGEYREIVRPERITWTFEFEGMPGHVSVDTVTFEERDGVTTLTGTSVYDSVEDRDGMLQSGMQSGMEESFDRLDEYLTVLRERHAG